MQIWIQTDYCSGNEQGKKYQDWPGFEENLENDNWMWMEIEYIIWKVENDSCNSGLENTNLKENHSLLLKWTGGKDQDWPDFEESC